jgi:hypothetical protein
MAIFSVASIVAGRDSRETHDGLAKPEIDGDGERAMGNEGTQRNRVRLQHSANLLRLALNHPPISFDRSKALPSGKSDSEVVFSRSPADGERTITRESLSCGSSVSCAVAHPPFHLHWAHC